MKPAPFEYHAPTTVDEAVALLAAFAEEGGRVIAGGQSFVPMMAFRLARPAVLIDLNQLDDLASLALDLDTPDDLSVVEQTLSSTRGGAVGNSAEQATGTTNSGMESGQTNQI